MSLYKPPNSACWWIDITHDGQRIRRSTGTENRKLAQQYHDKVKHGLWSETRMGSRPEYGWADLVKRYLSEQADMRTLENEKRLLTRLTEFCRGKTLGDFGRTYLDELTERLREGRTARTANGVSNTTVNRHLECLQRMLNRAVTWGWIDATPQIRRLKEPKGRLHWLTKEQATTLLSNLPPHLATMAKLTLLTGLRAQNCCKLEWSQVDIERGVLWIHADQAKMDKPYSVPLNEDAKALLRTQQGQSEVWVFPYKGKPLAQPSTQSWYRALTLSGLEHFTWHGLRHTWASWHVMAGTPLEVLQKLGGWARFDMVMRYAHLSPGFVQEYAERVRL